VFKPTSTGKEKWVIETNCGNYSVWDGKIAEELNSKLNENVDVSVRPAAEGSNYLPTITNIVRGINVMGTPAGSKTASTPAPSPTMSSDRDKSIIAQCLTKAVLGQVDSSVDIEEAVGIYKKAKELL